MNSGFEDLDKVIDLDKPKLINVAARHGIGTTTFTLSIASNTSLKQNIPTLLFNLELSKETIYNRIVASESLIEYKTVLEKIQSDENWEKLINTYSQLIDKHLFIDDTPNLKIDYIEEKCRRMKTEKNIKLVIIDYINLVNCKNEDVVNRLRKLVEDLEVTMIFVSKLSKIIDERKNHKPKLSDLQYANYNVQDIDIVLFLYRDDYYNKDSELLNILEVIIAKNESKESSSILLAFFYNYLKIVNLVHK